MDTSKLKSIRDRFSKLKHSVYTEDGTEIVLHPMLVIIFANGADKVIDKHDGSVYWDDTTEILYHFFVNNHGTNDVYSMSRGGVVERPMAVTANSYDDISRIEMVINEGEFDQLAADLKLKEESINNIKEHIFKEADIDYQTKKKRAAGVGYSNLHTKKYNAGLQHTDEDEYTRTVHPVIL